jgi:hypothetical protein
MVTPEDEQDWIERSRAGDHAAFASLIRLHQRMIHSLTFRMTGSVVDADEARWPFSRSSRFTPAWLRICGHV